METGSFKFGVLGLLVTVFQQLKQCISYRLPLNKDYEPKIVMNRLTLIIENSTKIFIKVTSIVPFVTAPLKGRFVVFSQ